MTFNRGTIFRIFPILVLAFAALTASGQSGNAGAVRGTVTDPTGAVIPGATVHLTNEVSGFDRTTTTDALGQFDFPNVPFNPYRITISAKGFSRLSQSVEIRSVVGSNLKLVLQIATAATTVTVEASGDLIENDPTFHTDVDRDLFIKVPMESQSSSLSSLVTETTPGVAADSNGLFHGLGDHASNSFSVDGQSITDQQSKVFSNQIPADSIQSIEVISGAPPAEYGGKTSLVIVATTRSGQGVTKPTGSISTSYGSFGSATGGFDLAYGGKKWGNFIEADGLNTGRFLDPPEFAVFHDKGNEQNVFDRVDYTFTPVDSIHLDLNYSRSWFQTPNSYDNLNVQNVVNGTGTSASPVFGNVGNADQRSKIGTINISPTYTRVINNYSVFNLGAFVRRDDYNYYPSGNPLADLGPANLQTSSISQYRTLTNSAVHSDFSYVKGINNIKIGAQYGQTFLSENDNLGVVDPTYNSPCVDVDGNPLPGYSSPSDCDDIVSFPNANYLPVLAPYDLTRGGSLLQLRRSHRRQGTGSVCRRPDQGRQLALQPGSARGRLQRPDGRQPDRAARGHCVQRQADHYRAARLLRAHAGNAVQREPGAVQHGMLECCAGAAAPLHTRRFRNSAPRIPQRVSRRIPAGARQDGSSSAASTSGSTPTTPSTSACWATRPSLSPSTGITRRFRAMRCTLEVPEFHHFSAYLVASSVAARFFPPQIGGAGATVGPDRTALPHRSRRKVQPDHTPSIHDSRQQVFERHLGRLQLALRFRSYGRLRSLLQPALQ